LIFNTPGQGLDVNSFALVQKKNSTSNGLILTQGVLIFENLEECKGIFRFFLSSIYNL